MCLINACRPAFAATFVVQSLADSGPGTLRQAISTANTNTGLDTITFNIVGAPPPFTILLFQTLPAITDPVVIDGTTQPGFAGRPIIEVRASGQIGAGPGLHILAGGSTVRGLVINQFPGGGVMIEGAGGNLIAGNFIGTDLSGTNGLGNSAGAGNVIINNSSDNVIGGTTAATRNLISGNAFAGVQISGDASVSNRIRGNFIGTDLTGTNVIANPGIGVFIKDAISTQVGGSGSARNIICGNAFAGVFLMGGIGNMIQGNLIGTDASGSRALGNGRGIYLQNFTGNSLIGGLTAGLGNVIAFNGGGVLLESTAGTGNAILGNSIFMNDTIGQQGTFNLGINLNVDLDAVTPNDPGDADSGPNGLQNYPDLMQATSGGSNTVVTGILHSQPNQSYRQEFFSNPQCNPLGAGEGKTFLGAQIVTTDTAGNAPFSFSSPTLVPVGTVITATATDTGNNTSEFSPCVLVQPPPDLAVGVVVSPSGPPVGMPMTYTLTLTGTGQSTLTGTRVTNQLPSSVTFLSATPSQGSCMVSSNGVVICDIGDFPPSATPIVQIKVLPNVVGSITNKTSVGGTGPDADSSNNSAITVTTIYQPGPPMITKQPRTQTVQPGSNVVLHVDAGPSPLTFQWRRNGVNLPNETNDTLLLPNFSPFDGGSYTLIIRNDLNAIRSETAIVQTDNPPLTPSDAFAGANLLPGESGLGGGDNFGATSEPGEPRHVGKSGGKSVWFDWIPTENGIATFSTSGSTFDTLLAAYTGTSVSGLTEVSGDEDSGNFLDSTMTFNAMAGTVYHIVIDGFSGQEGFFLLTWKLTGNTPREPEILVQPVSQTVGLNQPAELSVIPVVQPGITFQYQWFFNGQPIAGANMDKLIIPSVGPLMVGTYFVRIVGNGLSVDSRPTLLQVNDTGGMTEAVLATGKFRDVVDSAAGISRFLKSHQAKGTAHGFSGTQIFSSVGVTTEPGEPIPCGVIGGASSWFSYEPPTNGVATITTDGSSFDTVLAIYTGPGDYSTLVPVTCDNNSGTDGLDSKVSYTATGGTTYWIQVDGVGGASGTIKLSWKLDPSPQILVQPASLVITNGGNASFSVTAMGTALAYQWRFNGGNLPNQTNATLVLPNASYGNEGGYSVVVTNRFGSITSTVARLTVLLPLELRWTTATLNGVRFTVAGSSNVDFMVEASTNFVSWNLLLTTNSSNGRYDFTDTNSLMLPRRFYRARNQLP